MVGDDQKTRLEICVTMPVPHRQRVQKEERKNERDRKSMPSMTLVGKVAKVKGNYTVLLLTLHTRPRRGELRGGVLGRRKSDGN